MTGVYLAYAIDQHGQGIHHLSSASQWLADEGAWVFDPGAAFSVRTWAQKDTGIRAINAVALDRADVVVAWLMGGTVTIGVPMEVDRAVRAGKVVCVISDAPSWMLQFEEENVQVFPEWGADARKYLSEALRGISERLTAPGRPSLPVVVSRGAEEPRRGYADDAGLDLVVSAPMEILPGQFRDVPCGVSVQLPEGTWGMLTGRSSTLRKRGLLVNQGVIDTGYRGPLYAGVWNMTDHKVDVLPGERIAQLILLPNITQTVDVVRVAQLDPSDRGHAGFGSTGT